MTNENSIEVAVRLETLENYMIELFWKIGMTEENSQIMTDIYLMTTKRGVGHHDIYNLPSRIDLIQKGMINISPVFTRVSGFGGMESWDGDNGPGELINHFSMQRAIDLAKEHGMGMCVVKNSNHYLCSAPYVKQAADQGCIGLMIAKGLPSMGLPGINRRLVGQSPIGYAFPVGESDPVMLDTCLAYVSGEELMKKAVAGQSVPSWWGVDRNGEPTTEAAALLRGIKNPIGEHKGFGLAILCELLTGVLSGGYILDDGERIEGMYLRSTSHAAIAFKADALMPMEIYEERSSELVGRLRNRAEGLRLPGDRSWTTTRMAEEQGSVTIKRALAEKLNEIARAYEMKRYIETEEGEVL